MYTKTDFRTYDEYVKMATEPPKAEVKPLKVSNAQEKNNKETKQTSPSSLSNDNASIISLEDEYEMYKFEWLEQSAYSIYDLVDAIIDYAVAHNMVKELISSPSVVVAQWEDRGGFAEDMYLSYDEWLVEREIEEAHNSKDDMDDILEIVDYLDSGWSKAQLIDTLGFERLKVDKAMEYYRSMGCPVLC